MSNILIKGKVASHVDLGWTEDEYNNFLIDMFECYNGKRNPETKKFTYFDAVTGEKIESDEPISATISFLLNK